MNEILEVTVVEQLVSTQQELLELGVPEQLVITERVTELEVLEVAAPEQLLVDTSVAQMLTDLVVDQELLEVAQQGPQGSPGPAGPSGTEEVAVITAAAIGGHRVVVLDADGKAIYADYTDLTHSGRVYGLTTHAAVAGASINVRRLGSVVEGSWTWTPFLPVYLGANGVLTQVAPSGGFSQIVGVALAATRLFINPREPLTLA